MPRLSGQYTRPKRTVESYYTDPIRQGWPGPRRYWTKTMQTVFDQYYYGALAQGLHDKDAWVEGYRAVVQMPQGKAG